MPRLIYPSQMHIVNLKGIRLSPEPLKRLHEEGLHILVAGERGRCGLGLPPGLGLASQPSRARIRALEPLGLLPTSFPRMQEVVKRKDAECHKCVKL